MPKSQMPPPRGDALVTRLEDLLLAAPISELAVASRKPDAVADVRRIIGDQLTAAETRLATGRRSASHIESPPAVLGRSTSQRPSTRAVFGTDKASAQDKVKELISTLSGNRKESKHNKK